MFEVMADLEALCAGYAAVHTTPQERNELEALHDTLGAVVRSGDPQRYHELNERFHGAIYDGSHNDYLAELAYATCSSSRWRWRTSATPAPSEARRFPTPGRRASRHAG